MNRNRYGLTLVEVVAAMLLLGTLLVSLLTIFSRQAVQIQRAAQRLQVMQTAEKQLADWHLQFGFAPVNEEGEWTVNGKTYYWRTQPLEQMLDRQMLLGKISFEVFSDDKKTLLLSLSLFVPAWTTFD